MIDGGEEMSEARARDIVSSICGTLADLHAIGIIHRDVKPEHVMLTPEGKVYLIDLDAAMQLAPEKKSDTQLLGPAVCASGGGAVPQRRPGENYRKMHGDESGFQIPKRFRTSHRFGARGSFRPEDKASSHL